MSDRLLHGRLIATVSAVVDSGFDLLPTFEMAVIPMLDSNERPAELPQLRRRIRAEGIRAKAHRGSILLEPGELDQFSSVGLFNGFDELFLCAEWNDELEPFPGRITSDSQDMNETTPLGLEEWMADAHCLLALGDGTGIGLNFATFDAELERKLKAQFKVAVAATR